MYLDYKLLLKNDKIYYFLMIISFIIVIISTKFIKYTSIYNKNETNFNLIVTDYTIYDNRIYFEFKGEESLIGTYYFKTEKEKNKFIINLGDTININGNLTKINNNTNFNSFNYNKYLYNKKIFYKLKINSLKKIKNNNNLFYQIKNSIIKHMEKYKYSKNYLYLFIIGNKKYLDENVIDSYNFNGISHIFSISGTHISLVCTILYFILKKMNYYFKNICIILSLIMYMYIISFSPSVMRAGIFSILCIVNKLLQLDIKLDKLLYIEFFILILIDPFIIYDIGFQFSYIISLSLIKSQRIICKYNNKLYKLFTISLISFLAGLPICIYNFNQISMISIILNLIIVPIVTCLIFPLAFITLLFKHFDYPFFILTRFLEQLSLFFSNIKYFQIILAKPNILVILLYYILIILCIKNLYKNYQYLITLFVILFFHNNILLFKSSSSYVIIDVSQGDSSLLIMPNNSGNILIDTGGNIYGNSNITRSILLPFLKSFGIKKIDCLIITHGDYDHMGDAINLVENFKVEKVIFNCGEFNELEKELIKVLGKKKISYYSCIKELNIDDNKLYFLNNKDYGNENDNSSVIYTELNNHKFLFMGDAGLEVEQDLIKKYNLQDIDVLKVGHHGSKTSSSEDFIEEIDPEYSIISVGKNNRYGHPNKEVLNNLESSKIYRTDQDGSIMFKIKNNKLKIETCSP